jgi:hypothetical protein
MHASRLWLGLLCSFDTIDSKLDAFVSQDTGFSIAMDAQTVIRVNASYHIEDENESVIK